MEMKDEKQTDIEVRYLTTSELLVIRHMWGLSTNTPDWVYQKAKEQVILDGLRAQKSL